MANKKDVRNYNKEVKEGVILVGVLLLIVLVIYLLTIGAQKIGMFDEGYTTPEVQTAVISYDSTIAGSIFNKVDNEYYVLIADFSGNENIYLKNLMSIYKDKEKHLSIYSVDLSSHFNKSIIGEESNPSAQSVSELSVNEPTLIFIKDGRNHRYVVGSDNIKNELGI